MRPIKCFNIKPGYFITEYGDVYSSIKIPGKTVQLKLDLGVDGYRKIHLVCNDGIRRSFRIHRLVAATYIPNIDNYPIVLHLDNNKLNNHYLNLKWGTIQENTIQAYNDGCCTNNLPIQILKDGVILYEFISISELCRFFNYSMGNINHISKICSNQRPQFSSGKFKGYIFRYKPLFTPLYIQCNDYRKDNY